MPIQVFFLWHLHQPWYPDLRGGAAALPWVRLHALKDYADLAGLLSREPRVPQTVNLVPALLDQLEHLAGGGADHLLEVARRPSSEWDEAAADTLLSIGFSVHPRMVSGLSRFAELGRKRASASGAGRDALRRLFTPEDLRDLAVLFHLAWCGPELRKDPLVARLLARGRRFSEEDKDALLARQHAFLGEVLPAWKRAFDSGVVEACTSPYHHPILPLLVDSSSSREATPKLPQPELRFRRPEDARAQVELGLATFERHFGFRPKGLWPPEGSLSEEALALLGTLGLRWVASDEEVLLASITGKGRDFQPGDRARTLFQPYRLGTATPALFFRDRLLSDRIGFSYATWTAGAAAQDFVARLRAIREAAPEAELVVPVILDGENPWESYEGNGVPFLTALVDTLAAAADIEVTTPSRALAAGEPAPLARLVAGSWIGGNFTTWIGDPSKNRAWSLLSEAREALASGVAGAAVVSPLRVLSGAASAAETARAALLAAEASDWFWWFGEPHSSAEDPIFDALFRGHLATAYEALGRPVPDALERPLDRLKNGHRVITTTAIAPVVDGARPDYFEWLGAGRLSGTSRGTMARKMGLLKEAWAGFASGGGRLFLRLDPTSAPASRSLDGRRLRLLVLPNGEPETHEVTLSSGVFASGQIAYAVGHIVEIALPSPEMPRGQALGLRLVLLDGDGQELEALPAEGWAFVRLGTSDWSV